MLAGPMGRQYREVGEIHFIIMVKIGLQPISRKCPLVPVRHDGEIDKVDVSIAVEVAYRPALLRLCCSDIFRPHFERNRGA